MNDGTRLLKKKAAVDYPERVYFCAGDIRFLVSEIERLETELRYAKPSKDELMGRDI